MEWQTTSTILDQLRDYENATAWSDFVDRFRDPIRRFALSLGLPEQECEDIAQEALLAFAEAYRDGRYERDRGRLSSWLFGITYHQVLRRRRAFARNAVDMAAGDTTADIMERLPDEAAATDEWEREWERSLLRQCLECVRSEFAPETIDAFELSVRDDKPAEAVATALGVPVKAVYNAKHRVLRRIRKLREIFETIE